MLGICISLILIRNFTIKHLPTSLRLSFNVGMMEQDLLYKFMGDGDATTKPVVDDVVNQGPPVY